MEKRPEERLPAEIPVRVWGMDADGKPFFQNATASNLSSEGAQLSRVQHSLKIGEVIGIQHGDKKARFEVKWLKPLPVARTFDVGVRLLAGQQVPWADLTAETKAARNLPRVVESTRTGADKRKFARHRVQFPIAISFADGRRTSMQCAATDISGRGCYVETLVPLAVDTEVVVTFWLDSQKLSTKAVVRASDPGVGMGIEFLTLDPALQQKLQAHLERTDQGFASAAKTI